ncbi:endonuclease/exonuclease/phosphatase family protein [Maribacter sp. MMG018]|uniref:endonuclease/exonuclease/phosphatase family protein n=1 Tax=Maribacter sp. MMG018 TaxID=2822688 RepID=UPI001B38E636|nr:endonuclease/exonuclease/phosphatase family protein [Maribacter sp. MMG018]MBQ4913831.1 endonuclease/exonuclease/phosphatase family protein [Maribacter sp. MMG018]
MFKKVVLLLFLLFSFSAYPQQKDIRLISWNIQDFGKTKNSEELEQIAELVRDADIVAIQEVVAGYGGAQAVAKLSDLLNRKGAKWDYVISDPTKSPKYATERYAFVWKTKHIKIKNRGRLLSDLKTVIDREPFLLDFFVESKRFTIINFHSRPHNKDPKPEITALTDYIITNGATSTILAGDFNVNESDPIFDTFKKKGYTAAITDQKTTLKRSCDGQEYRNHAIDNIFYPTEIQKIESEVIDFIQDCDNLEKARDLSDHLPVYIRFRWK